MVKPQQPELARSGQTDLDPDHAAAVLESQSSPRSTGRTGPVPPDNQPGHQSAQEQDKPSLDDFAARLGMQDRPPTEPAESGPAPVGDAGPVLSQPSFWPRSLALALSISAVCILAIRRRRRRSVAVGADRAQ